MRTHVLSILALGLLDAFVTSLAPSAAIVTLVVALGLALGNVVSQGSAGLRPGMADARQWTQARSQAWVTSQMTSSGD